MYCLFKMGVASAVLPSPFYGKKKISVEEEEEKEGKREILAAVLL